jgi:pyruvate,orthophosphate dikinase
MSGLPVTIRLLDPPLHEFLPHTEEEIAEVAGHGRRCPQAEAPRRRAARVQPDARLPRLPPGVAYPEIAEMQARAIFEAAVEAAKATGQPVVPEIMVPLVMTKPELDLVKARIVAMAKPVFAGERHDHRVPGRHHDRAAARLPAAGEIAETAEFFSFGTNDLTQTTSASRATTRRRSSAPIRRRASCRPIRS